MNWHKAIADADTPEALLAVVNEYLVGYPEAYWSWIPREARPRLVATVDELYHQQQLLSERLAAIEAPNIRLQDVCVFFLHASARALELSRQAPCCNDAEANKRESG